MHNTPLVYATQAALPAFAAHGESCAHAAAVRASRAKLVAWRAITRTFEKNKMGRVYFCCSCHQQQ